MKLLRVLSGKDLDEINEFLGELKDGDAYKKRLAALEDQKKEVNALIEVYGKVEEIEGLNLKARQLKEGVEKLVEAAQKDRAAAKDEAAKTRADAGKFSAEKRAEANANFSEREQIVKTVEGILDDREKAHARSLDDLASRESQLARLMETALAIQTTYTEAVAALRTAIEQTAKAL